VCGGLAPQDSCGGNQTHAVAFSDYAKFRNGFNASGVKAGRPIFSVRLGGVVVSNSAVPQSGAARASCVAGLPGKLIG
jgi:hypothetical protein